MSVLHFEIEYIRNTARSWYNTTEFLSFIDDKETKISSPIEDISTTNQQHIVKAGTTFTVSYVSDDKLNMILFLGDTVFNENRKSDTNLSHFYHGVDFVIGESINLRTRALNNTDTLKNRLLTAAFYSAEKIFDDISDVDNHFSEVPSWFIEKPVNDEYVLDYEFYHTDHALDCKSSWSIIGPVIESFLSDSANVSDFDTVNSLNNLPYA